MYILVIRAKQKTGQKPQKFRRSDKGNKKNQQKQRDRNRNQNETGFERDLILTYAVAKGAEMASSRSRRYCRCNGTAKCLRCSCVRNQARS